MIFVFHVNYWLLGVAFICFPLINFLERASEQRFEIKRIKILISDRSKIPLFRVWYYFVMSICSVFFILGGVNECYFIPIWGYLFFRFIILQIGIFHNRVTYG